jgi:hypothetical protein
VRCAAAVVAVLGLKLACCTTRICKLTQNSLLVVRCGAVGHAHGCSYLGYSPVLRNKLTEVRRCCCTSNDCIIMYYELTLEAGDTPLSVRH